MDPLFVVECRVFFHSPKSCGRRNFLSQRGAENGRLFLQIGAGAGDRDPRTNFKDGFTDFVKGTHLTAEDRVVLVEPNPENIELLKECWRDVKNAEILQVAVLPWDQSDRVLTLWYSIEDGPHFQLTSHERAHVEKYYPQGTIRHFDVAATSINRLLHQVRGELSLEFLGIDVEGLDAEVLLSIDWSEADFHAISYESVHMAEAELLVHEKFRSAGYIAAGVGIDTHGLDTLVLKPDSSRLKILPHFWEVERQAHLYSVDGKPWKSMLYLINWLRTRNT